MNQLDAHNNYGGRSDDVQCLSLCSTDTPVTPDSELNTILRIASGWQWLLLVYISLPILALALKRKNREINKKLVIQKVRPCNHPRSSSRYKRDSVPDTELGMPGLINQPESWREKTSGPGRALEWRKKPDNNQRSNTEVMMKNVIIARQSAQLQTKINGWEGGIPNRRKKKPLRTDTSSQPCPVVRMCIVPDAMVTHKDTCFPTLDCRWKAKRLCAPPTHQSRQTQN